MPKKTDTDIDSVGGPISDLSGSIASGATAQTIAALDLYRRYILIQNPSNAVNGESLFVDFGMDAINGAGSIELLPGGAYERAAPTFVPNGRVSINAPTTGHAFTAKVG